MNSSSALAKVSAVSRRLRRLSSSTAIGSSNISVGGSSTFGAAGSKNNTNSILANAATASSSTHSDTTRRWFGSGGGTRGARGHGWWVNYRAGKGGRHLQGKYAHLDQEEMASWNDAVFSLGSTRAYLDVVVESLADNNNDEEQDSTNSSDDSKEVHRLELELATAALPRATENVAKLFTDTEIGYQSSTLHRIEKGVGLLGGLVADNPHAQRKNPNAPITKRRMGRCHPDFRMATSPTAMDISDEKLVLNHLEGVFTMLQPRIGEIDSRFLLLAKNAHHLDGVSVAVGRIASKEALEQLQEWESSLITSHGVPTNVVLRVVGCGLLEEEKSPGSSAAIDAGSAKQEVSSTQ